jgi:hypothetical protein
MRPLRLLLSLTTCIIAITLLLYASFPSSNRSLQVKTPPKKTSKFRALFSWTAPTSLFPPSAIISLTDDNSTFFLARPANFGPALPANGLSGPLWVGSSFAEDVLGRNGMAAGAAGELGCSDVPGWSEGDRGTPSHLESTNDAKKLSSKGSESTESPITRRNKRDVQAGAGTDESMDEEKTAQFVSNENDGTDDHLHRTTKELETTGSSASKKGPSAKAAEHADIQSIQEGAEIAGKIVLLSRGGCGFLEKVKWTQRRGGTALIVGDNIRGEPLISMYAHGDTSNITIPALFTSYTTAHLLSSLMPSGGQDEMGSLMRPSQTGSNSGVDGSKSKGKGSLKPPSSTAKVGSKISSQTSRPKATSKVASKGKDSTQSRGWFSSLLSLFGLGHVRPSITHDHWRPPSSGSLDWVLVEDFVDEQGKGNSKSKAASNPHKKPKSGHSDGFEIGVHDWRDPDLLPEQTSVSQHTTSKDTTREKAATESGRLKGGSIMPGSGEYAKPSNDPVELPNQDDSDGDSTENGSSGWLSSLRWGRKSDDGTSSSATKRTEPVTVSKNSPPSPIKGQTYNSEVPEHEGLWVTLTPTSMSSSPFFDTLLVLVVSPLVTLTVVYALLLLRSRIRRRRWRAPKSVVERLPVRTYHTLPSDNSSPNNSPNPSSPTTPLLASHPRPTHSSSRPRPRSRTTSEVPAQTSSSYRSTHRRKRSPSPQTEKRESGLAEWRRRYGGKQKECVVCLEEYVDGVSRVMSLPCGHEFHAECM